MQKKNSNAPQIVIDDGTRAFPIVNKFGQEICTLHFRPADYSIYDRYKEFRKDFADVVKPLESVDIKSNGEAEFDEGWQVIKQVEKDLLERLNFLLDTDDAQEIFAKRNAFSAVEGKFFCEIVLDAIGSIIQSVSREETEKANARIEKYIK